jgi:hypothetical protein
MEPPEIRFELGRYWWLPGFLAAWVAVAVPYVSIPHGKVDLPDALLNTGLVVVAAAAALTRVFSGRRSARVAWTIGAAVPTVVAMRVVSDTMRDPTSHNLWPFEIVIAMVLGGAAAAAGALIGRAVLRVWHRGP